MMNRRLAIATLVLAALTLAGCAKEHLTASQGHSTGAYFHQQAVNPEAGDEEKAAAGLDSQEAAIVADNYKQSLQSQGSQSSDDQQLLIVSPPRDQGDAKLPPPSIPEGEQN